MSDYYYVYPSGTPSHTSILYARYSVGGPGHDAPFPSGHTITWRKNSIAIKGPNPSGDPSSQIINSHATGDYDFWAGDTGCSIDFVVDSDLGLVSSQVFLSNQQPTLSATAITDAYLRSAPWPTIAWTYSDADGDAQFLYRVRMGTLPNTWNICDTGTVTTGAATIRNFALPHAAPYDVSGLPYGSKFYWALDVSDGEKNNPLTPDPTTDCVLTSASGWGFVSIQPSVGAVWINGQEPGVIPIAKSDVRDGKGNVTGEAFKPVVTWNYSDLDGQPQAGFRIVVANDYDTVKNADPASANPITATSPKVVYWDSGKVAGTAQSATYGEIGRRTAAILPSHVQLFIGVSAFDGLVWSPFEAPA